MADEMKYTQSALKILAFLALTFANFAVSSRRKE